MRSRLLQNILLALASLDLARGYQWPSPQYDSLESYLYEGGDNRMGNTISLIVEGCHNRGVGPPTSIAAEWLRLAYHDMATHNITDGTGGLDASIYYELDRAENVGNGQVKTAEDFAVAATKYVSRADVIALGVVWGVAACGGPVIKFKGGRKDATRAGLPGVPEPTQDLATHVEKFRLQGFNESEMIQLVACGHTIGVVRSVDFPDVVKDDPSAVDKVGLAKFDTTPQYDPAIVTEYLNGTTQNPLIVSNVTFVSDLRIFSSDGNVTMKSMATPTTFSDTCASILARMLDTVPSDVQLTEEIELLPVKVRDAQITVVDSKLVFMTSLRLSRPVDKPVPQGRKVSLFWCDRLGPSKDCAGNSANVVSDFTTEALHVSPLGVPMNIALDAYEFAAPLTANQSLSKFWFVLDDQDSSGAQTLDNGGAGYVFSQDEVIFIPALGSLRAIGDGSSNMNFTYVVGIRKEIEIKNATILGYTSVHYPPALNYTVPLQSRKTGVQTDGYTYYSGHIVDDGRSLHIDIEVAANDNTIYKAEYYRGTQVGSSFIVPHVSPASVTALASIPSSLTATNTAPTTTQTTKLDSGAIVSVTATKLGMVMGVAVFSGALLCL